MSLPEKVEIKLEEAKEVFECLEELQAFLHQPDNYASHEQVSRFLRNGAYQKLHRCYYDIAWNWLPPQVQQEYESR